MKVFLTAAFTLFFAFSAFAQKQAEVIVTSTYLRQSPDLKSEKVETVQKGDVVVFEKSRETNGWFFVSIAGGTIKGWIRKDTIGAITNAEKIKSTPPTVESKQTPTPKPVKINPTVSEKTPPIKAAPVKNSPPLVSSIPKTSPTNIPNPVDNSVPLADPSPSPVAAPPAIEEDNEVLRIDTDEVSLNVRVVDGNNRSVNNLTQSQFVVYEDDVAQPITALTTTEVPMINALVIDNSRSLRSQLQKVIEAGKIIVGTNRPNDESAVVRFVSADKIEVVQDFTSGKIPLDNALDNLFVEGGQTAIIDAVYLAAKKVGSYQNSPKKDDTKLRSLVLVSDGDDRGSSYNEQQLFKLLRDSNVQIYAIGFVNDLSKTPEANDVSRQEKAKAFLTRLAEETGGKVYFPNSIDELPKIATDISSELRTQYLVSYAPTNVNRDGGFRKIKVEITEGANKEKRIAITRTGRNASPK